MRKLNMETAIKRYNILMGITGHEHNQIGTCYSDGTENWTLRDMVAEIDYHLSTYYENGHVNCDLRYSFDADERKMWRSETEKLKRFIKTYEPFISEMKCFQGHCSNYD